MSNPTRRPTSGHSSRRSIGLLAALTILASIAVVPASASMPVAAVVGLRAPTTNAPSVAPGLLAELAANLVELSDLLPPAPVAPKPAIKKPASQPAPKPVGKAKPTTTTVRTPAPVRTATTTVYRGTNHVWSSALGLNRAVYWFPCSRSTAPGMVVYRWGCAGHNNVYLFAHAGGPFWKLHDLYVSGRLRKGMTVVYADGSGHVHKYAIAWWRVVLPTNGAFAWASLSRPSMTLQTCVGSNDRYRLVVRLYQVS